MKPGHTSPTLNEKWHGFLYVPFQLMCRDEGDKARLLPFPPPPPPPLSESAEPLWNSTAYLVYSKIFKLTEYALFVLTLRMCLLESYKSVTTTTFSKVWTFSSLRTRPMSSSSEMFDRFVLVTFHPPYFSINFTNGSFPRLLMAVVLRQEL